MQGKALACFIFDVRTDLGFATPGFFLLVFGSGLAAKAPRLPREDRSLPGNANEHMRRSPTGGLFCYVAC